MSGQALDDPERLAAIARADLSGEAPRRSTGPSASTS
jgi:hypothetical protein